MFHLYDVETEDGWVSAIAALPPDYALEHGLPSPAVVGSIPRGTAEIALDVFTPNPEFADFMQLVISRFGAEDPALGNQARAQGDGWVFMIDLRADDVEEELRSEDIIGAFQAKGGEVVAGSYRANPKHRLLSERGLLQLDEWVQKRLVEELMKL
jgi:hypothetical protein